MSILILHSSATKLAQSRCTVKQENFQENVKQFPSLSITLYTVPLLDVISMGASLKARTKSLNYLKKERVRSVFKIKVNFNCNVC